MPFFENVQPGVLIPSEEYCHGFDPAEIIAGWTIQTPSLNQKIMLWGNLSIQYLSVNLSLIAEAEKIPDIVKLK